MIYVILNDVMCQLLTIIIRLKSKKKFFLTEYLAFLRPASKKTLPWLLITPFALKFRLEVALE